MTTDAILTLTQWLSPSFPVGAFAYSHGLETSIAGGAIDSIETLEDWLIDIVSLGGGRADVVCLANAYRSDASGVAEVDRTVRAFAASAERLMETEQQGASFARTVDAVWQTELGALTYPVAVARAARARDIPLDLTAQMYLHAFAANLISAAVRLVPLGQTEGQGLLARLAPLIKTTADHACTMSLDDLASPCFAADIAAMQHETLYSKVFRT
ncbi:urease accessory protein UreF [Roseobacter sinensis]|uniref:Urease accessory protein UreF n=1 Tax=Roseobacter sinensis TaxID=2931391 RepID=A0ABT3BM41_9RHOB|nr:urease accessory UreF family protein [Roseobacter sp. WL0113]MCV3274304.1 urease accessory protein UreF [Roseobacter sp. WL0113]